MIKNDLNGVENALFQVIKLNNINGARDEFNKICITIQRTIKSLVCKNLINRVGSNKNYHWKVEKQINVQEVKSYLSTFVKFFALSKANMSKVYLSNPKKNICVLFHSSSSIGWNGPNGNNRRIMTLMLGKFFSEQYIEYY